MKENKQPEYTISEKQGLYSALKYYPCPKCDHILYKGDEKCQNCNAKIKWENPND